MACETCKKNRCCCPVETSVYKTYTVPVAGKSAYELWRELPGNEGKTLEEYLASQEAQLVWESFNI